MTILDTVLSLVKLAAAAAAKALKLKKGTPVLKDLD